MASPIFAFDFETTGLDPKKDQVVQAAAIMLDGVTLQELRRMSVHVKIRANLTDAEILEAEGIHHKSRAFLEEFGLEPDEALEQITDFIGLDGLKPIPCGHNVSFDTGFLREWMPRSMYRNYLDYHTLDTMSMAMSVNLLHTMGGAPQWYFPTLKLKDVYQKLTGVPLVDAHDALKDIEATVEVLRLLTSVMKLQVR